jgi:hypothetical protein
MKSLRVAALALAGVCGVWLAAPRPAAAGGAPLDPALVMGPEQCGKCHGAELEVWRSTDHAKTFTSSVPLHRRPQAIEIAQNLGLRLIKQDSPCLDCHFTPQVAAGKHVAIAGVSCESCHGAARNWINEHNRDGNTQAHRLTSTPEALRARREREASLGMYTAGRMYDLAARCYQCHMVPDEHLVDAGKHTTGGEFDLLTAFNSVRHNFVSTGRGSNGELSAAHKRQLFLLGMTLELEYGLRGLAAAKEDGNYAKALARRIPAVTRKLKRVQTALHLPEMDAVVAAASSYHPGAGHGAEAAAAADKVRAASRGLVQDPEATRLAALDPLVQEAAEPPAEEAAAAPAGGGDAGAGGAAAGAGGGAAGGGGAGGAVGGGGTAAGGGGGGAGGGGAAGGGGGGGGGGRAGGGGARTGGGAAPAGGGAEGAVRAVIRPALSNRRIVGEGKCATCHGSQSSWLGDDAHSHAADGFMNKQQKTLQIATLYYGAPAAAIMVTGKSVCMNCHSTVPTGREGREVESGVGCESCHGPAGDYLSPHPGKSHPERVQLGMTDLVSLDRRAEVCTSCHYITDPRLLAAGHTSGKGFDLVVNDKKIEHWKGGQPDAGQLRASLAKALGARGAIPVVHVAQLTGGGAAGGGGGGGGAAGGAGAGAAGGGGGAGPGGGSAGAAGGGGGQAGAGGGGGAGGRRGAGGGAAVSAGGGGGAGGGAGGAGGAVGGGGAAAAAGGSADAAGGGGEAGGGALDLGQLPDDIDKLTLDQLLRLIQQRLDALHNQSGGHP